MAGGRRVVVELLDTIDAILDIVGDCKERLPCPGCGRTVRCDQQAGHVTDHTAPPCPVR